MTSAESRAAASRTVPGVPVMPLVGGSIALILVVIIARLAIDTSTPGAADASPSARLPGVPVWIPVLLAAALVVACWAAYAHYRARTNTSRQLRELGNEASRIALGEYDRPVSAHGVAAFEPITDALGRLATLLKAAGLIIEDHDVRLTTITALSHLAYWETDADGVFTRLEAEAWRSPTLQGLVGRPQFEHATPLDRSRWIATREAIAERRPYSDLPVRRLDAHQRPIRLLESGMPRFAPDGAFLGYTGVTRWAEADPGEVSADAARVAAEASAEPVLMLSTIEETPKIEWANPAASRLFERSESDLVSSAPRALFDADQPGAPGALDEALRRPRPLRCAAWIRNRWGERLEVQARLVPLSAEAGRALLVLDPRDAELARLRARLNERDSMRDVLSRRTSLLEARTREIEAFAYGVSHDLRAPLRVVEGYAKLLEDEHAARLGDGARDYLAEILTGCARMNRMIDGVLALTRITSQPLFETPVDLGRLAREVMSTFLEIDRTRRIELRIGAGLTVQGDPTLLRTLLENLLGNAWKYTAQREVATISLSAEPDAGGQPVFCVSDNGVGFDMRHADRLFDMFQRLHRREEFPGTGIGLASARTIVQRHGGNIWAESTPGEGSRFYFTIRATSRPR